MQIEEHLCDNCSDESMGCEAMINPNNSHITNSVSSSYVYAMGLMRVRLCGRVRLSTLLLFLFLSAIFMFFINSFPSYSNHKEEDEDILNPNYLKKQEAYRKKMADKFKFDQDDTPQQMCKVPKLTLRADANKFDIHRMDPLECNREELFTLDQYILRIRPEILGARKLTRCLYKAIEWETDNNHRFSEPLERKAPRPFELKIKNEFFHVECYIEKPNNTHEEMSSSEEKRHYYGGIRRLMQDNSVIHQNKWRVASDRVIDKVHTDTKLEGKTIGDLVHKVQQENDKAQENRGNPFFRPVASNPNNDINNNNNNNNNNNDNNVMSSQGLSNQGLSNQGLSNQGAGLQHNHNVPNKQANQGTSNQRVGQQQNYNLPNQSKNPNVILNQDLPNQDMGLQQSYPQPNQIRKADVPTNQKQSNQGIINQGIGLPIYSTHNQVGNKGLVKDQALGHTQAFAPPNQVQNAGVVANQGMINQGAGQLPHNSFPSQNRNIGVQLNQGAAQPRAHYFTPRNKLDHPQIGLDQGLVNQPVLGQQPNVPNRVPAVTSPSIPKKPASLPAGVTNQIKAGMSAKETQPKLDLDMSIDLTNLPEHLKPRRPTEAPPTPAPKKDADQKPAKGDDTKEKQKPSQDQQNNDVDQEDTKEELMAMHGEVNDEQAFQTDLPDYPPYDYNQFNYNFEMADFEQFFAQIVPKEDVLKRVREVPKPPTEQMNVLVLAMDSMSHLMYQRKLPKTYDYIQGVLHSVVLNGYNIVGDATTAAIIPMTTGHTEEELPEVRKNKEGSTYVDAYPLIWNKFEQRGYVTLFTEDKPDIAVFNLRLNGFEEIPTDHYMRPFYQAVLTSSLKETSQEYCTGGTPSHQLMVQYLKQFFDRYPRDVNKFAFGFLSDLSHDDNNPAEYLDADLVNLLEHLRRQGHLDNTVVIIMADHGARYNSIRRTTQGKLEERLPMMSLAFPPWFQKKYPHLMMNLRTNANRLTTPFDIHATLLSIVDLSTLQTPMKSRTRGISLLRPHPLNRTCHEAGVEAHWCTCMNWQQIDSSNWRVQRAARVLIEYINAQTNTHRDICSQLKLNAVIDVKIGLPNEKVLKYLHSADGDQRVANFTRDLKSDLFYLQVIIETLPGQGLYEATMTLSDKGETIKVVPGISRINKYGSQAHCVMDKFPDLRLYCYCSAPPPTVKQTHNHKAQAQNIVQRNSHAGLSPGLR